MVRAGFRLGASGDVPLPGRSEKFGPLWAATVIGTQAHLDDFDDTHLATVIHPGAVTLASLWTLAGRSESTTSELVAAALGVEVQLRVGLAMTPEHYDAGWHITGTCGVLGAAVNSALRLGMNAEDLAASLGAAASMTVGVRESFGTMAKPYHAGKAASNGLFAALLRTEHLSASLRVLEAPRGFFGVLNSGRWRPEELRQGWGTKWTILENSYKPYPCGVVTHPAIEAATRLHRPDRDVREIEEVRVVCNPLVTELMGNLSPTTGLESRFSAVHLVAAALMDGQVGLQQVTDGRVNDPTLIALRDRVHLDVADDVGRGEAHVYVRTPSGTERSDVEHVIGSLERPLTDGQLDEKFRSLVEPVLGELGADRLSSAAWSLGRGTSLRDVQVLARPAS
jgi:2-methylcitrate dehydratase PrpD